MAMTGVSILVRLGISRGWHVRLLTRGKFYAATLLHCMFVYLHLRYQLRRTSMWITNYYIACLQQRYLIHVFYMRFPNYSHAGTVRVKAKKVTWNPMYRAFKRLGDKPGSFYRLPGYHVYSANTPRTSYPFARTVPLSIVGEEVAEVGMTRVLDCMLNHDRKVFRGNFKKRWKFDNQMLGAATPYLKVRFATARRAFGVGSLSSVLTVPTQTMRVNVRREGHGVGEFYRQPNAPKTTVVKVRRPQSVAEQMVEQARLTQLRIEELEAQGKTLNLGFVSLNRKPRKLKAKAGKKLNKKAAAKAAAKFAAAESAVVENRVDKAPTHTEILVNRTYDANAASVFDPAYREAWAHSSQLVNVLVGRMMLSNNGASVFENSAKQNTTAARTALLHVKRRILKTNKITPTDLALAKESQREAQNSQKFAKNTKKRKESVSARR